MTQDEIDTMWQQAMRQSIEEGEMFTRYHFAKLVAAKEREACVKICMETEQRFAEFLNKFSFEFDAGGVFGASQCLNAIRARGEA
jgi:hypothetical protein